MKETALMNCMSMLAAWLRPDVIGPWGTGMHQGTIASFPEMVVFMGIHIRLSHAQSTGAEGVNAKSTGC